MLLGLEEVEQVAAAARPRAKRPSAGRAGKPRRASAGSTAGAAGASAAHRDGGRHRRQDLPVLRQARCTGSARTSRERLDIVPAQFRVLVVRRPKYACRACEDVVVQAPAPARLIEGGIADRGDGRAGAGLQIRRPSAALSPGPDLRPPGHRSRSLDAGRLGRPRRLPAAAGARAAARRR